MRYFEIVISQVPIRRGRKELCLWEIKASVENVASEDDAPTKKASLEGKRVSVVLHSSIMILAIRVPRRCMRSVKVISC